MLAVVLYSSGAFWLYSSVDLERNKRLRKAVQRTRETVQMKLHAVDQYALLLKKYEKPLNKWARAARGVLRRYEEQAAIIARRAWFNFRVTVLLAVAAMAVISWRLGTGWSSSPAVQPDDCCSCPGDGHNG